MIKKSVFEDELIAGMQRELQPFQKKAAVNDLVKAAEYLHSAVEIFEEAGMTEKADQVLRILAKIAGDGSEELEADDNDAPKHKSKHDQEFYEKVSDWIKDPESPTDPMNPQPGDVIEMETIRNFDDHKPSRPEDPSDEYLTFKSIAQEMGLLDENDAKPRKPKDPTKVHAPTSEQQVKNLKNHGTVFNMADDGFADDLLNVELSDKPLEVMEPEAGKTFEDSD